MRGPQVAVAFCRSKVFGGSQRLMNGSTSGSEPPSPAVQQNRDPYGQQPRGTSPYGQASVNRYCGTADDYSSFLFWNSLENMHPKGCCFSFTGFAQLHRRGGSAPSIKTSLGDLKAYKYACKPLLATTIHAIGARLLANRLYVQLCTQGNVHFSC